LKFSLKPYLGLFFKVFLPLYLLFVLFTFPTDDIKHVIQQNVSKATKGQIQLQFDSFGFEILPNPGLGFRNVSVISQRYSPLKMQDLHIAPAYLALLSLNLGAHVSSNQIFDGSLDLKVQTAGKNEQGNPIQQIQLQSQNLELEELLKFFNAKQPVKSKMDIDLQAQADQQLSGPIDARLSLKSPSLRLNDTSIPTQMGAISIPALRISDIDLQLDMEKNRFEIINGKIGDSGDTIYGSISGDGQLQFRSTALGPKLSELSYDLIIKFNIKNAFLNRMIFKSMIESYLRPINNSESALNIRVSANRLGAPPRISRLP
tara:strand:+ start:12053 stop:13003 length:951 start_codon:yes stop_codon:yes gene_type:complete